MWAKGETELMAANLVIDEISRLSADSVTHPGPSVGAGRAQGK